MENKSDVLVVRPCFDLALHLLEISQFSFCWTPELKRGSGCLTDNWSAESDMSVPGFS
jgi:hypothetical protein